ncbi:MAG: flagellar filament capping protein FliD, partial [Deltaproteobacteria bacterium]|nr:flagellar filament capping protein FliD [Deltaproteobacteria bacterium]
SIDIFQGVTLSFAADSPVYPNDFFTVDVWHPDLQLPQDDGLAKAEKEIHSGFIDQDTTPVTTETSSFSYTYNGKQRTLSVDDGTTLSQLVDQINNDSLNPGVTASIIDDGSGLSTAYHLVLTGDDTGSAYKIENINTTFTQSLFTNGSFSESQSAQNAMLKIDGYPTGDNYLQRTSNTITDVIAGLTLALTGAGTSTVTVNNDTEAIKQNISDFVDAFNDIRRYIKEQTSYDTETEESGILLGNYGIDTIKNRLNSITSSVPSGFRTSEDTYVNLMQLGISTDANTGSETSGELVIDYAALDEALTADPQAVADFFSEYFTGRSTSDSMSYDSYIPGITDPGTYFVEFNGGASPTARVRASGSDTWYSAEWDATSETITVSGGAGSGLSIRIGDPSLSFSGEIDLKRGLAGDLKEELDFLSNADSGPLGVLEENYNDIIDMIETKIENEEERIALYEQRLVERYARLEQVLTELNAQSRSLDSLTAQLS